MKWLLILCVLLGGCKIVDYEPEIFAPPPKKAKSKVVVPMLHRHIVKLETQSKLASGFALTKDHILTAAHFCGKLNVGERASIKATFVNSKDRFVTRKEVEIDRFDLKIDVCVLKKKNHGIPTLPLVRKYKSVKMRDSVTIGGAPVGIFPYTDEGYVINPRFRGPKSSIDLDKTLLVKVGGTFGISGGPVINEGGAVIGMAMAKPSRFDNAIYCVRSSEIKRFLMKRYGQQFLRR